MRELPWFLTSPNPEIYRSNNYVVLDFETTIREKGSALDEGNRILLAVWRFGSHHPRRPGERVVRWGGEYDLSELVEDIRSADYLVAHNAKFELQWLERCGLDLGEVLVWDTMIGEYVIGGNRWVGHNVSLERCAQRRYKEGKGNVVSKLLKAGVCTTAIPASWLEEYCVRDVELTNRLFEDQRREQIELGLLPVMYTRCLVTPVLADIEKNGMQVDSDLVCTRLQQVEIEFAEAERTLNSITGGINLNSTKQLGEFLYDGLKFNEVRNHYGKVVRTAKNKRKTDADTLSRLKPRNKKQREFVEIYKRYKELYNELTKYLRKFSDCAKDAGGILHASFNQTNTQTHRLSSTGTRYSTQFQNFPRIYKPLFTSRRRGWVVGECDGAQLEFRIAAHLGRDSVALGDIIRGEDIHSVTAEVIGISRQEAKAHTFKPLYGGQSGTDSEVRYYNFFREKYQGITEAQRAWIDEVLTRKYLVTEWGLRYYWPNTRMDRSGYVTNTTSICNYPVQGFATAEIIPISLVYFWHRARARGCQLFLVNTIHDSIIAELPEEEIETFHELSRQCLIDDVYFYLNEVYDVQLTVPLGAGVKVASHWSGPDAAEYVPTGAEHKDGEVTYTAEESLYEKLAA